MRKHVLVLTTTAAILSFGADVAIAQQSVTGPNIQQSPTAQPSPGDHGMMGDLHGMMGHGIIGDHPGMRGNDGSRNVGARLRASRLRDGANNFQSDGRADGDGKLTLQEWQAAHERIFKAMDTDHDGTVSLEEMEAFMHGTSGPASPR